LAISKAQFQEKKDLIRKNLLKYTRKAFRLLPELEKPRILDVGCGSGIPTIELASLSDGEIIGMDIDQTLLNTLLRKAEQAGVSDRVRAVKCSISDTEFPAESFDIIWAEGSIHAVGFKRGLQEWKRLVKPGGFMAIHDEQGNLQEKLELISSCGYQLLGYFMLDENTWWNEYFSPLDKLVNEIRAECADDPEFLKAIHSDMQEIEMFKKNPEIGISVFFVIKKNK